MTNTDLTPTVTAELGSYAQGGGFTPSGLTKSWPMPRRTRTAVQGAERKARAFARASDVLDVRLTYRDPATAATLVHFYRFTKGH